MIFLCLLIKFKSDLLYLELRKFTKKFERHCLTYQHHAATRFSTSQSKCNEKQGEKVIKLKKTQMK